MSLMLGALALTSCNNLDSTFNAPEGNFTFKVSADTRAGIDNNNVVWQSTDTIALGAIVSGSNDTMAVAKAFVYAGSDSFTGNIDLDENTSYDFFAVYPYVASKNGGTFNMPNKLTYPDEYNNYLNVGNKTVNQSGESMDGVMKYAPMFGTASGKTPANLTIPMHHLAAMLDFTVVNAMEDPITIKSLQMTTPTGKNICGTYYVATDGSITPSGNTYVYNNSTVVVSDAKAIAKGESFHVYMPIAPVALDAASEVEFKITADAGECVISKTLSNTVSFEAGTISTQTLNFEGKKIDYATLEDVNKNGAGNYTVKDVIVLGISGSNAVVGDGTGYAIIYSKNLASTAAGNTVELSGSVVVFNGVMEFDNPVITVTDSSTDINRGSAVAFGDTELQAYASNPTIEYVSASGSLSSRTLTISDNGYFWCYDENNSTGKYASFNGKNVDVKGYTFGFQDKSGKTSVSFMITEISEQGGDVPPTPPTPPTPSTGWTRVTSASDLTSGGTFIIGYEATANSGVIVPMRNQGTMTTSAAGFIHSGTTAGKSTNGTIDMATVTSTSDYEVTIVPSTVVSGAICIKIGSNFIGNTNTKNNCKLFAEESATTAFDVTIGTNDAVTLKIAANSQYNSLQYNANKGSERFAVYTGGQKNPVIYKKN